MKNLVKNVVILFVVFLGAYFFSLYFGEAYFYLFPEMSGGSFIISENAASHLRGSALSYIFFLTLLFTAFGARNKYWWMGILLIPAALVEIYLDLNHIYIPIVLALAGWLIGFIVSRLLKPFWQ